MNGDASGAPSRFSGLGTYLPANLRDFQLEVAGRLVLADSPGGEIKALRERYGFTQDWLSHHLGLRRESLSRIEGGRVQLGVPFIQRFTKIVALAKGVREHLASVEVRGGVADENFLAMVASSLRLEKEIADDVVLVSMINYEQKRRQTLRDVARKRRGDSPPARL